MGLQKAVQAVDLRIGQNFTGSTFGTDSDASPADADGAVGPSHFTELINGRFSVYDKTNGKRVKTMTDVQFWNAAGVRFASTVGVTDPRVIFDVYSQRWFASMVDFAVNSPRQRSNHFLLAVSQTSDPTGSWTGFSFAADTNSVDFADFPTMGLDQNAVYLSGDMFDRLSNPVGPTLVAVPKSGLLAATPTVTNRSSFGIASYTSRGDILQPAVTIGMPTTPELVLAVSDVGIDFQPHNTLVLSTVQNAGLTNATLASPATVLSVPSYTVPINPPQPDGSSNLDNGDARFASAARRVNDLVYLTHAVEVDNRAAIRWYLINAASPTLLQSGTITHTNLDLFYPSIAANEAGTVVLACNGSSLTTPVGSYAAVGASTNGNLSFGELTLLKAGTASYQNPDSTGISRWGDYSTTTVDPADPTRFWTIQMISASRSAWATQITEILTGNTTNAPTLDLSAVRSGTNLEFSWPANSANAQLQVSPSLDHTASWTAVNQVPVVTNGVNTIVLPISAVAEFFRLFAASSP